MIDNQRAAGEQAKLKALGACRTWEPSAAKRPQPDRLLEQAAREGWADVAAGRYAEVDDEQLEDFVGRLGRRAARQAKTADR